MNRSLEILKLRNENNLTYSQIGIKFGISRERVRQILNQQFVGKFKRLRDIPKKSFTCSMCNDIVHEKVAVLKHRGKNSRFFCSIICFRKFKHKNKKYHTEEERRKYHNLRCLNYYHVHKNEPQFQARIKKANKKACKRK